MRFHGLPCAEEAAHHVGIEDAMQTRRINGLHARLCFQRAGVIHQSCNAAKFPIHGGEEPYHIVIIANIGFCTAIAVPPASRMLLYNGFRRCGLLKIADADFVAALCGQQSGGCPNTAASAGDDDYFSKAAMGGDILFMSPAVPAK